MYILVSIQCFLEVVESVVVWVEGDLGVVVEVDAAEAGGEEVGDAVLVRVVDPLADEGLFLVVPVCCGGGWGE